jgi:acetoin utilization deacetylase AcuC-like enzyme
VGGVFSLLDAILAEKKSRGFAFVRPPGHHAERDKAMGFCLLNNCALGALYALDVRGLSRIMIIDVDAHHGNGIQKAFYQDDRVLYVSLHQYPAYPGTGNLGEVGQDNGLGFNVNIPLSAGQKDLEYARILHYLVRPLSEAFQPELIIVPMGFDLYLHDPLAGMRVSSEGYALMTYLLLKLADKVCSGKIAFVMEGGYSLDGIRHCGLKCMRVLAGLEHPSTELLARISQIPVDKIGNLQKVIKVQKQYWQSLP